MIIKHLVPLTNLTLERLAVSSGPRNRIHSVSLSFVVQQHQKKVYLAANDRTLHILSDSERSLYLQARKWVEVSKVRVRFLLAGVHFHRTLLQSTADGALSVG